MRTIGSLLVTLLLLCSGGLDAQTTHSRVFDVVVYEATPGGIAAAVSAARLGSTVALLESQSHIGGMTASGLSKSDIETQGAVQGFFREFVNRVDQYYVRKYGANSENVKLCRHGYYYEPSVAERVLNQMVQGEPRITLMKRWRLAAAIRTGNRLTGIEVKNLNTGDVAELRASVFIDASYEGDLAAYAGAAYRIGREARSETNELDAGVVYMDSATRAFLPGTTGKGDKRIPAYTYRLCLTDDPANAYPLKEPPPDYDRRLYLGYIEDWKAGRMGQPASMTKGSGHSSPTSSTVARALSIAAIPNHKFDANINPRPLGFFFSGENYEYPDGTWAKRDAIARKIRNQTLGLLYFLQNDPEIPLEQRQLLRRYNLPKDEFADNGHFPWQLYVREARRVVGEYTLSEHDLLVGPELGRTRVHADCIASGEFPIDAFPVRRRQPGHDALEGYILMMGKLTHPYQIPYGVIVPKSVDGLLVPVAASATHVAFSSLRMEPTWMALGQAAGVAANLSIKEGVAPRGVDIERLQRELVKEKQVLTYFKDVDPGNPAYGALEYFGTKGFFHDYLARSSDTVTAKTAREWLNLAFPDRGSTLTLAIQGKGSVTLAELRDALHRAGIPAPSETFGRGALTRGEFCRVLYDSLGRKLPAQGETRRP
ncbi:MAG TPA: FAD-dependent oxidoreductase [Terriglobia bacterium]|nr:FAD-dependent oxidoreductase [Terriglobia bacterium]